MRQPQIVCRGTSRGRSAGERNAWSAHVIAEDIRALAAEGHVTANGKPYVASAAKERMSG